MEKKDLPASEEFLTQVEAFRSYLDSIKKEFNKLDSLSDAAQITYLLKRKIRIFSDFDRYFEFFWRVFNLASEVEQKGYKRHCERRLLPYLYSGNEINKHVRKKPLGYAGDYQMMNYIYDYQQGRYLGRTPFAKLINHYTCNVDVSNSNIHRKDYLKNKLFNIINRRDGEKILSVGCGSAREIVELLKENRINRPVIIHLLDLEKAAIQYVQEELNKIAFDRDKIKVNYHVMDLIEIVRSRKIEESFGGIDFLYVSGVFDYLSDRVAKRVLKGFLKVARSEILIFNMSLENARHRFYYEILGEWGMFHRTKDDMLHLGASLGRGVKVVIEDYPKCRSYWILKLVIDA